MNDSRERPAVWLIATALSLLLGLQPLTTDLYLPALPLIQQDLQAPMGGLQLTMSALILSFGLAQLVWGPVADRFGRRPVLLTSLSLYAVASAGCAWAPNIAWLVGLRAAQGATMAAAVVVGRATIRDLYEPLQGAQVMSRAMTGLGAIALVSVPIGGWLTQTLGWRATLLTNSVLGVLILLFMGLCLRETLPRPDPSALELRRLAGRAHQILQHPTFRAWAALVTCTYAGLFVVLSTSSFVFIQALGLSPLAYGWTLSSNGAAYLVGTLWCRRWIVAHGLHGAVRRGATVTLLGGIGLALVGLFEPDSVWPLLAALWLLAFGHGIHQPCGQTGAVGPFPQMAGTASALAGFILATTAFLIGLALGSAFDGSVRFMAWGAALGALATAAVAHTAVQRQAQPASLSTSTPHEA